MIRREESQSLVEKSEQLPVSAIASQGAYMLWQGNPLEKTPADLVGRWLKMEIARREWMTQSRGEGHAHLDV